jgi:oligopeptide/dipeptide ABC transporter ATP-binding protein
LTLPPVLELRAISASASRGRVPLLIDIAFSINRGEIVGLVGESGSGKSMTARCVTRSLPEGVSSKGEVRLNGEDLASMRPSQLRDVRARSLGVIFQDARLAVDPLWTIEDHLTEGLRVHGRLRRGEARARAVELLKQVGIRDGDQRLGQYPGQLSGGMLQRVVIAGALASDPSLIIADEPTTALDVTTQAEIVAIFSSLRRERGLAMLFITHDLGLAASLCDRILVMYAGRIVESQASERLFSHAAHPYTRALLAARPLLSEPKVRLPAIPGAPVSAANAPPGCAFHPRCEFTVSACLAGIPPLAPMADGLSACRRSNDLAGAFRG